MAYNLNQVSAMSVQELVRDGGHHDLYYYDHSNMFTQSRPTLVNNKFIQSFVSFNSGVNQLIFSPDQGLTDVICGFALYAQDNTTRDYRQYALNRGWGYALINQVAVRYGGSSQYFWSGEQMLMENVIDMQDAISRDVLFELGGQACMGINPLNANINDFEKQQIATCYINLPHNTPNGDGLKMAPLPSELLRQPVLVQIELKNSQFIFSASATAVSPILPFQPIKDAWFQVKQVRMINSEDLLTSHHEPSKIAYTLPLKYFAQQEYVLTLPSNIPTPGQPENLTYSVNLTGFRNGGVRSVILWLVDNNQQTPAGNILPHVYNPFKWIAPEENTLSINGEIYYRSKYSSSLLLDLVNNKQPNQLSTTSYIAVPAGQPNAGVLSPQTGGVTATYLKVDFSQVNDAVFGVNLLVSGRSITNSIVNYNFSSPYPSNGWVLHAMYLYNSSLVFSGGNAEYVF
jgi:hypothetical protein